MQEFACAVYWEQRCNISVKANTPEEAQAKAVKLVNDAVGFLDIRQPRSAVVKMREIHVVEDSVNCNVEIDVRPIGPPGRNLMSDLVDQLTASDPEKKIVEYCVERSSEKWNPMSTAPRNGTWVRVLQVTGFGIDAHWAEDLSGEDQPPFSGWFIRHSPHGFVGINDPIAWRPMGTWFYVANFDKLPDAVTALEKYDRGPSEFEFRIRQKTTVNRALCLPDTTKL